MSEESAAGRVTAFLAAREANGEAKRGTISVAHGDGSRSGERAGMYRRPLTDADLRALLAENEALRKNLVRLQQNRKDGIAAEAENERLRGERDESVRAIGSWQALVAKAEARILDVADELDAAQSRAEQAEGEVERMRAEHGDEWAVQKWESRTKSILLGGLDEADARAWQATNGGRLLVRPRCNPVGEWHEVAAQQPADGPESDAAGMRPEGVPDALVVAARLAIDAYIDSLSEYEGIDRDDEARAIVAAVLTQLALTDEYGIRVFYTSTLTEERTVADTLGEALAALDRFDAQGRRDVVSRELIQRPVGEWRKIGKEGQ